VSPRSDEFLASARDRLAVARAVLAAGFPAAATVPVDEAERIVDLGDRFVAAAAMIGA
jgi:hypothetical protein